MTKVGRHVNVFDIDWKVIIQNNSIIIKKNLVVYDEA